MKAIILHHLEESIQVKPQFIEKHIDHIIRAAEQMAACIKAGNKILIFGNGGSAADAQHLTAEFVNRFKIERPPQAGGFEGRGRKSCPKSLTPWIYQK